MAAPRRRASSATPSPVRGSPPLRALQLTACGVPEKESFSSAKVEIVGISPDPVDKQRLFVEKQKLTVRTCPVSATVAD